MMTEHKAMAGLYKQLDLEQAARAMLAALAAVRGWDSLYDAFPNVLAAQICAAIAQAEAAGIKED